MLRRAELEAALAEAASGLVRIEAKFAHSRPVRKNRPTIRTEVHETVADSDPIAARYTLFSSQRGKDLAIEVYFFGRFASDGRMRQAHMTTRTVPVGGSGEQNKAAA
ncbi:hypothetical protein BJ996_007091 [Streptomyces phaeogriseichromatogenes]|nr:hypothetical protein [Streptomyces murinus]